MTAPYSGGAIDLGEVKARAEARARAQATPAGEIPAVVEATMDNFQAEVLERSQQVPVIVQVGTARSPQSEQLKQDLSTLAQQAQLAWIYAYLDADTTPDLARMLGVQGLPTVIALADGRPLADFQGAQPMEALQQWTAAVVQAVAGKLAGLGEAPVPQEDPRFAPATEALNAGDFEAAIAVYDDILAHEPTNKEALSARDSARLLSRLAAAKAQDVFAAAEANPDDVDAQLAAADAEIAAANPEAAYTRLLDLMGRSAGETKNTVKARLLELFSLAEPDDPRVLAARARLASVLF
ncbi:co-chaperone YbbN [Corynebacterium sp. 13CS0277]|uniref:tetratricopeptide repeat protein n=1 Tax=Corynebacterium sp. 13CS0277 TaxID=2071994 RepID=UPI000D028A02|nr:tetratricopeptide repeat protein [Corynebacterium sp. 13CS0277]PRQ12349.1 co-chaperone YbbN [Corynebacterium sp. 13CS0277]